MDYLLICPKCSATHVFNLELWQEYGFKRGPVKCYGCKYKFKKVDRDNMEVLNR